MSILKRNFFSFFLVCTSLAVLIAFYLFLRDIDARYTRLVQNENRVFNQLMEISNNSRHNFQVLYEILLIKEQEQIDSLIKLRMRLATRNDHIIDSLPNYPDDDSQGRILFDNMVSARQNYIERCSLFLTQTEYCNYRFLVSSIQPAFNDYQHKFEQYYSFSKFHILRSRFAISQEVENKSLIYLLIGVSPILLITTAAIVVVVFLTFALGILAKIDQRKEIKKDQE